MPVRRTSPSTLHGEMTERRADVPLGDGDSDRSVAQPRSSWLSSRSRRQRRHVSNAGRRSRFRSRPADRSSVTPAVAYDGDRVVSRRTLAPGLVRRADATPCVLLATAHWNRSSQQTAAVALTMRSSTSPHTFSQTPRSQSQRTLSSPISTQLHSARLFTQLPHTTKYVRSLARSTLICLLSRNFFASPLKTCASHVSTQSPDLTDSHKADLSGHARMQGATAYTWRQKINTSLRADPFTTATPQVEVHMNTLRAVLTIAASP